MKTLYHIEAEYQAILDELEQAETDEQLANLQDRLSISEADFAAKAEAYAMTIKSKLSRAAELKAEAKRLTDWAKAEENKAADLKDRIVTAMKNQGWSSAQTEHYRLGLRSSESVEVEIDAALLPEHLRRIEYKPDKVAIKAALEKGEAVVGVKIVPGTSLQIR